MIYLSGKIRGATSAQLASFGKAAEHYRKQGYDVFNPLEHPTGDPRHIFERDCTIICRDVTTMVMLRDYSDSLGAKAEKAIAEAIGDISIQYFTR